MKPLTLVVLAMGLLAPAVLVAQDDAEGCRDSKLVTRVPGCKITECSVKDFDSAEILVGIKGGEAQMKTLEGATEIINYECAMNVSPLMTARNAEAALRKAGYQIVYNGKSDEGPSVTGQNGAQWVEVHTWINGDIPCYRQTAVLVKAMDQVVTASADAWAAEIEKSGRVAVYGINFDTGKSTIKPDSEPVLREILTLLGNQAELKLRVEGHTDNVGAKASNQTLSQQRAAAVVAWLVGQGADKARLAAQGFGDTKPVADNASEEGRAKNRRVDLAKM